MIIAFAVFLLYFSKNALSKEMIDLSSTSHPCDVGDAVQNGRVTCVCNDDVYDCQLKKFTDLINNRTERNNESQSCEPNKVYVQDTTTCICNANGSWPHQACGEIFDALPTTEVVKTKCQPDGYVILDCNVCRCNHHGKIDKSRCTKNNCDETSSRRRSTKSKDVYGNCEAKNWYSLAPCQFCFCINENKLVCNTGNYFKETLSLGTYNLSVCGKDLIREAIELIPDEQKTLRHGEPTNLEVKPKKVKKSSHKTTSTTRSTFTTPVATQIDVLVEFNKKKQMPTVNLKSNNDANEQGNLKAQIREDYSESLEYQPALDARVESTQIPYQGQDDYQLYSKESKESVEKGKNGVNNADESVERNHRGLRIPVFPPAPNTFSVASDAAQTTKNPLPAFISPFENIGRQLSEKLPMVLTKVFNLALRRKSMVTVDNNSDCVPGAVDFVGCNSCFCLKNNKLLCTNNKCN